jgi:hypothetical protein
MTTKLITILAGAAVALGACAQQPENVAATYTSRNVYSHLSCAQLNEEARLLSARLAEVTGQQERAANGDAALTAVTLVLFWPAVFFIGHGDKAAELARLKGEAEAIQSAGVAAGCGLPAASPGRSGRSAASLPLRPVDNSADNT